MKLASAPISFKFRKRQWPVPFAISRVLNFPSSHVNLVRSSGTEFRVLRNREIVAVARRFGQDAPLPGFWCTNPIAPFLSLAYCFADLRE